MSATVSPNSTRAYQGAAGNLPADYIDRLERIAVGKNHPDLTLILDLPPEAGLERANARRGEGGADRFEAEGLAFHETLRRAFLNIAAREPERCAMIDALKSEDDVEAEIWKTVAARLDPVSWARSAP